MSSETFVEADIWTIAQTEQGNVVLIRPRGSDLAVPIIIGQLETQSILIGMGGVEVPRPLTHDLVVSLLRSLSAFLVRIEINGLHEGTFFSRLVIHQGAEDILVDSRPSDAIGIAVRAGCPVFISEAIVDEAGISVSLVNDSGPGTAILEESSERLEPEAPAYEDEEASPVRSLLQEELEEAIAAEDYERAAVLRDRLKDMGALPS